jgi:hypothetical protein
MNKIMILLMAVAFGLAQAAGVTAEEKAGAKSAKPSGIKERYVTLKGPEGKTQEIKVKDPKNLENVKVGDQVAFTYTEALAVSVEPTKKKK